MSRVAGWVLGCVSSRSAQVPRRDPAVSDPGDPQEGDPAAPPPEQPAASRWRVFAKRTPKVRFGVPLSEAAKNGTLPIPLVEMITYLAQEGIATADLFRRPGNSADGKIIIKRLSEGKPVLLKQYNFYTLASVLKKFLIKMPGGLFGPEVENQLLAILDLDNRLEQYRGVNRILRAQPVATQQLVVLLFGTFFRIANHCEFNTMSSEAVAKSVAGSMFHTCATDPAQVDRAVQLLQILIDDFGVSAMFGSENLKYFAEMTRTGLRVKEKYCYEYSGDSRRHSRSSGGAAGGQVSPHPDDLREREAALVARETALRAREAQLVSRELQLQARETQAADDVTRTAEDTPEAPDDVTAPLEVQQEVTRLRMRLQELEQRHHLAPSRPVSMFSESDLTSVPRDDVTREPARVRSATSLLASLPPLVSEDYITEAVDLPPAPAQKTEESATGSDDVSNASKKSEKKPAPKPRENGKKTRENGGKKTRENGHHKGRDKYVELGKLARTDTIHYDENKNTHVVKKESFNIRSHMTREWAARLRVQQKAAQRARSRSGSAGSEVSAGSSSADQPPAAAGGDVTAQRRADYRFADQLGHIQTFIDRDLAYPGVKERQAQIDAIIEAERQKKMVTQVANAWRQSSRRVARAASTVRERAREALDQDLETKQRVVAKWRSLKRLSAGKGRGGSDGDDEGSPCKTVKVAAEGQEVRLQRGAVRNWRRLLSKRGTAAPPVREEEGAAEGEEGAGKDEEGEPMVHEVQVLSTAAAKWKTLAKQVAVDKDTSSGDDVTDDAMEVSGATGASADLSGSHDQVEVIQEEEEEEGPVTAEVAVGYEEQERRLRVEERELKGKVLGLWQRDDHAHARREKSSAHARREERSSAHVQREEKSSAHARREERSSAHVQREEKSSAHVQREEKSSAHAWREERSSAHVQREALRSWQRTIDRKWAAARAAVHGGDVIVRGGDVTVSDVRGPDENVDATRDESDDAASPGASVTSQTVRTKWQVGVTRSRAHLKSDDVTTADAVEMKVLSTDVTHVEKPDLPRSSRLVADESAGRPSVDLEMSADQHTADLDTLKLPAAEGQYESKQDAIDNHHPVDRNADGDLDPSGDISPRVGDLDVLDNWQQTVDMSTPSSPEKRLEDLVTNHGQDQGHISLTEGHPEGRRPASLAIHRVTRKPCQEEDVRDTQTVTESSTDDVIVRPRTADNTEQPGDVMYQQEDVVEEDAEDVTELDDVENKYAREDKQRAVIAKWYTRRDQGARRQREAVRRWQDVTSSAGAVTSPEADVYDAAQLEVDLAGGEGVYVQRQAAAVERTEHTRERREQALLQRHLEAQWRQVATHLYLRQVAARADDVTPEEEEEDVAVAPPLSALPAVSRWRQATAAAARPHSWAPIGQTPSDVIHHHRPISFQGDDYQPPISPQGDYQRPISYQRDVLGRWRHRASTEELAYQRWRASVSPPPYVTSPHGPLTPSPGSVTSPDPVEHAYSQFEAAAHARLHTRGAPAASAPVTPGSPPPETGSDVTASYYPSVRMRAPHRRADTDKRHTVDVLAMTGASAGQEGARGESPDPGVLRHSQPPSPQSLQIAAPNAHRKLAAASSVSAPDVNKEEEPSTSYLSPSKRNFHSLNRFENVRRRQLLRMRKRSNWFLGERRSSAASLQSSEWWSRDASLGKSSLEVTSSDTPMSEATASDGGQSDSPTRHLDTNGYHGYQQRTSPLVERVHHVTSTPEHACHAALRRLSVSRITPGREQLPGDVTAGDHLNGNTPLVLPPGGALLTSTPQRRPPDRAHSPRGVRAPSPLAAQHTPGAVTSQQQSSASSQGPAGSPAPATEPQVRQFMAQQQQQFNDGSGHTPPSSSSGQS